MQKLLILVTGFLITTMLVTAQPVANYHLLQYTTDNGLPSNGIKGLQWDAKNEFLWMATEAGIVRFNGVDFKSYTKENTPGFISERMLFMIQNNAGKIYTSDQGGNIFNVDKSKPILWRKTIAQNITNPYVANYYLLGVSDIFFNTKVDNPAIPPFASGNNKIICISDSSCLIQNQGSVFYYSINLKNPVLLSIEQKNINSVFKINGNYFILNSRKELFLLNIHDQSLSPVQISGSDNGLIKDASANGTLFWQTGMENPVFIDGEKAWLLLYDGHTVSVKLICTIIPSNSYIRSVQYSEKNNLFFIGTESKGLIVITQDRVQSKKRISINSKNRNSYYSQIELQDGNILTNESDIIGDKAVDEKISPIKGKFDFNVSITAGNIIWYSQADKLVGHNCLHSYNKITRQTKIYPAINRSDLVTESGGKIYLCNPNGIGLLDGDSLLYLCRYPKRLAGILTFDFREIGPGILGIATCSGLLRYNTSTNRLDTVFSRENICVRNIWRYKDYVFFGTYGSGFYIYKNGVVKSMPLDKNRYLLYPHCFAPDDEGYCWISTNRGLFKASLPELIDAYENNTPSVYYHYFGKKDGMEMTELNGGCTPCALVLQNKTISFPTMDGLLWVNPEKANTILPTGEIFIDEILANNNNVNIDSLSYQSLPAQTQEIIIYLGYSAWCNKENIYIDYQLNNDVNWKAVNTNNDAFIRLGNLNQGKYILRIRKLNGFGINNYTYKQISFTISTPWYKKWWFLAFIVASVLGLFILFYQVRTRQLKRNQLRLEKQVAEKTVELQQKNEVLEKNNTINTRLISIISHDIITPLKFLNVAGKNLLEKKAQMPEELKDETIKEITTTSKELQLLSTNILNWIKYQNENRRLAKEEFLIHDMVQQVFSVLNSMAHQKNLKLINDTDPRLQVTQYFEPLRILIYNLITNAIHFSDNGNIIITTTETKEHITVSVRDKGAGMTKEQIKNIMADQFIVSSANVDNKKGNGLGYLIIKDLLKMMGAKLSIESEKGLGTAVYVELHK